MKTNNNDRILVKLLLTLFTLSLYACASSPKPDDQMYSNEPVIVSENIEPPTESGVSAPVEMESFVEPPVEEMNGIVPGEELAPLTISSAPLDYFTVQLVASSTANGLNAFAAENGLSNELTAQVTVNNKVWNVLLLGIYPTLEEAKAARDGIKSQLNTSPWVRTIGSLH
ncbi:MAG: SPOR domain-containing protein [Gammaproteobacteria bacterium]|nr:SPOR domain-containing protein [Gammaproteobacteria bacterium]